MLIKLILGISLALGSNFIGTEKEKNVIVGTPQLNGTIQFEEKTIYVREKNTGEAVLAVSMILVGTGLVLWYLSDKDKRKEEKKKEIKMEKKSQVTIYEIVYAVYFRNHSSMDWVLWNEYYNRNEAERKKEELKREYEQVIIRIEERRK